VLVNNAGVAAPGALGEMEADVLERLYLLNALAPAELCRQAIPGMAVRGRGHIVNVSSLAGCAVLPGIVAYSATKAALTHLTAGLRADLRGLPIGTTVVEVGLVKPTGMYEEVLANEPTRDAFARLYRLGIIGDTDRGALCGAVVDAVARGRRHVRRPRRAFAASAIPETIRRATELLLAGAGGYSIPRSMSSMR
jgi:NAD(P)-dependent dehydrogenase (short-subunit alcohol dehydrogenase family)